MKRQRVGWMAAAVGLSLVGLAAHNFREFGAGGLLALETGVIPMAVLALAAFGVWWRMPKIRQEAMWVLLLLGMLHLVGAVLTVLPLGFLPFSPEQSTGHYMSHVLYGAAQLPLVGGCVVGLRDKA